MSQLTDIFYLITSRMTYTAFHQHFGSDVTSAFGWLRGCGATLTHAAQKYPRCKHRTNIAFMWRCYQSAGEMLYNKLVFYQCFHIGDQLIVQALKPANKLKGYAKTDLLHKCRKIQQLSQQKFWWNTKRVYLLCTVFAIFNVLK